MRTDRIESLSKDHDLGGLPMISSDLFTYDFHQHPLPPPPVKLAVKDPLPRAKVEAAVRHSNDDLAAHNLPFQMRVRVILAGAVVPVLVDRRVRRQLFEPYLVIVVQATLIVVDENTRSNVPSRHKAQALLNATFPQALVYLGCDVDKCRASGNVEPQLPG